MSPAFSEDPVRILRLARFAARFGFDIAPETEALMRAMVANGEVDALVPERVWQEFALDAAAADSEPVDVRLAALVRGLDPYAVEALADRLKAPAACRDLAVLAARHANAVADAEALSDDAVLELLNAADAWRRPERFSQLLRAAVAGERGAGNAVQRLERARAAASAVDAGAIAKGSANADEIRERWSAARLDAIGRALANEARGANK